MSQATLAMFWIAEYSDGMAFPQFDPDTGAENLFRNIDFKRLCRFGWYPFSTKLNGIVPNSICLNLPFITAEVRPGETLIAHRTVSVDFKPSSLKITNHIADEYTVGLQGKYSITINVLKNTIRCS